MSIPSSASAAAAATSAAAVVAGTSRAAAKGGTADQTAIDAQQAARTAQTGGVEKTEAAAKTEMDSDRDADGRQVWDVFERQENAEDGDSEPSPPPSEDADPPGNSPEDSPPRPQLDLEM